MIGLTGIQQQIQTSLITAIGNNNPQMVQKIFEDKDNEYGDIQAVLSHEGTLTSDKGTILDFVIDCPEANVNTKVEIIELIWKEADQKTRNFLCSYEVIKHSEDEAYSVDTMDNLKHFQGKIDPHTDIYSYLGTVIQEIEKYISTSPAPTTGNTTPEKNDATFWSEHKGKIALGVTGLCVAGAIAAYMLAYPAVALALTVLAAVILVGAGIDKVCEKSESPNTKSLNTVVSGCCNNAGLPN